MASLANMAKIHDTVKAIHIMRWHLTESMYTMIRSEDDYVDQNGLVDVDKFHKMILCAKEAMGLLNLLVEFQLDDKWRKTLDS